MANLVKKIHLIYCDIQFNNNKHWIGELFDNGDVKTSWARVGANLDSKLFPNAGESFLLKKEREKMRKGYSPLKVVSGNSDTTTKSAPVSNLHIIAHQQLAKSRPELSQLIDRLVKANIHNITSQTNITFNSVTGLFQTPLGIVTPEAIVQARDYLVDIKKVMDGGKKSELAKLVSLYMRIVPQRVGHKLTVESVFPDNTAVQKQSDILDSLEASYNSMLANPVKDATDKNKPIEQVFAAELDVLTDAKEIQRLTDFYHSSMKSMHGYGRVKIRNFYKVRVNEMEKNFQQNSTPIQEVYHGSSMSNILSILKSGLKVNPPSTAYIAGKMFSNGIYGAINSSKSLGYTFGRWGGSASGDSGWLLVCDFALGRIEYPTRSGSGFPHNGYDSVWAKPEKTGLNHDEIIVYDNTRVRIKYLLECK